jgi:hypothetical protein
VNRLSIFSSDSGGEVRFWRFAALTCFAILAFYFGVMETAEFRATTFLDQRTRNLASAEGFLLGGEPELVVVGSSLCARLDLRSFQGKAANLCLNGGSPLTGLELLRVSGFRPRLVAIETNLFFRRTDGALVRDASDPRLLWLKSHLAALREDRRPIDLLLSVLKGTSSTQQRFDPTAVSKMIDRRKADNSERPSEDDLDMAARELTDHVNRLARAGTEVVFFEMPVAVALRNVATALLVRSAVSRVCSETATAWFRWEEGDDVEVTDGVHLTESEAARVANRLLEFFLERRTVELLNIG